MLKKATEFFIAFLLVLCLPVTTIYSEDVLDYPVVDGSTTTIALDAAFKSAYLGMNYNEIYWETKHSKTFESFDKLLAGEADIILSVPVTDEQTETAKKQGFSLYFEPVALEGFVFIVNPENPVNTLSQSELRDIFSGKITNWAEIGGEDAEIRAYQRNEDSGSQSFMNTFMGDTALITPPTEWVYGGMGHLTEAISDYDNSKYAIGYTVYSYALTEQAAQKNLKMIAVDDILPSRETFENHTYPLMSYTYAYYNGDTDNALVHDVIGFMLSDEGQKVASEYGYYPVRDIPAEPVYSAKGTGEPRPEDRERTREYSVYENIDEVTAIYGMLEDSELERKINSWVLDTIEETGEKGVLYSAVNGYMNVVVGVQYGETYYFGENNIISVWNLKTGEKLEKFSDMFYEGSDFVPAVNRALGRYYSDPAYALLGEPSNFSATSLTTGALNYLYFPNDTDDKPINILYEAWDYMPAWEYYDMKPLFKDEYRSYIRDSVADLYVEKNTTFEKLLEPSIGYSRFLSDEEIIAYNNDLEKLYDYIENSQEYKDYDYTADKGFVFNEPIETIIDFPDNGAAVSIETPFGKYIMNRESGKIDSPETNKLLRTFDQTFIGLVDIDMDGTAEYIARHTDTYYLKSVYTYCIYDKDLNLIGKLRGRAYDYGDITAWMVERSSDSSDPTGQIIFNDGVIIKYGFNDVGIFLDWEREVLLNSIGEYDYEFGGYGVSPLEIGFPRMTVNLSGEKEAVIYTESFFAHNSTRYVYEVDYSSFNELQNKIAELKKSGETYVAIDTGYEMVGITPADFPDRYYYGANIKIEVAGDLTLVETSDPLGIGNTVLAYCDEDGTLYPFTERGGDISVYRYDIFCINYTADDAFTAAGKDYGETTNNYRFYRNGGEIHEYGSIAATEEDFIRMYDGAKELEKIRTDGGVIKNVYYNKYNPNSYNQNLGSFVVNYTKPWNNNPYILDNYYRIYYVRYMNNSSQLTITSYNFGHGTYIPSLSKYLGNDIAVYPEAVPTIKKE
jgi:phosphate transport system substrate-binding protein